MKKFAPESVINSLVTSGHTEIEVESLHTGSIGFTKLLLLLFAAFVFFLSGCRNSQPPPAKPAEVEVTAVVQRDVSLYGEWVATLDGYVNAQIKPQVTGYLIKQNYSEGSFVKKDQVLWEIDPRTLQASLDQAKAELAQAQAQLGKTILDVERDTPLAKEQAIAQMQLDNDIQAMLAAKASVEAAKAQVEQDQINLGFTKVTSLIDGIAGIAQAQIGDLVGQNSLLTNVSQVDPIKAYISISEKEYLQFAEELNAVALGKKTLQQAGPPVPELILANGTTWPFKGSLIFTDLQVDPGTGTIRVATAFPNPGKILRPGQYGRVRAATTTKKGALLVPQRAVTELQGSYEVAVVGSDNKVSIRPVNVGERVGTMWIINEGLKPGERVVVEGVQKVRDGAPVSPKLINPPREGN
jgi:membrane fusion protein (multidrug efflux system)